MIRKATKKDLDSVVRIYESVLIEEEKRNEKMVGWVRGIYPTDKTAWTDWNRDHCSFIRRATG